MSEMSRLEELALVVLLGQRFEDGQVYPHNRDDRLLLKKAVRLGLVTRDGYLTPSGHAFWRARSHRPHDPHPAGARHLRGLEEDDSPESASEVEP